MRRIEVSPEVWAEIAKRGKFGETEDDVLRREFGLPGRQAIPASAAPRARAASGPRKRFAEVRMSSYVRDRSLIVEFHGGARNTFSLPDRADKLAIRRVRDKAVEFARDNGASYGQEMAVKKALTEAGYHLMK